MAELDDVPTMDDYRRGIADRWKLVVGCAVALAMIGLIVALLGRGETWATNATVEVNTDLTLSSRSSGGDIADREVRRRVASADADLIEGSIAAQLEAEAGAPVSVTAIADDAADTIDVDVQASSAERSRATFDGLIEQLTTLRRSETLQQVDAELRVIDEQLTAIDGQVDAREAADPAQRTSIDNLLVQRSGLQGRQLELQELRSSTTGGVRVTGSPTTERADALFPPPVLVVVGLVVGAGIGLVIACVLTFFDRKVRTRRQLSGLAPELPTLGVLTDGPQRAETLASLQLAIAHHADQRSIRSLQITPVVSATAGARVLVDLATAFVGSSERVVAVDGDLRRGGVSSQLGLSSAVGLSSLTDATFANDLIALPSGSSPVTAIAAGTVPGDPNILQQPTFAKLLTSLRAEAFVLVGTAPVPTFADAALVAREADATLLVVPYGEVTDLDVSAALEIFAGAGCRVDGFIIDGVPAKHLSRAAAGGHHAPYVQHVDRPVRESEITSAP